MDKYSVKLMSRTLRDLDGIYDYIAHTLLEPGTALKASPHNCVCGLRPIFCPIRAVIKRGNTYSIPALL